MSNLPCTPHAVHPPSTPHSLSLPLLPVVHSHAEKAGWWELTSLSSHAHPTVSKLASTLLSGQPAVFSGDPIQELSLSSFLDGFAERKPRLQKAAAAAAGLFRLGMPGRVSEGESEGMRGRLHMLVGGE